ncbi:MAG TPA: class I SAM-dependent methyltransferase [Pyrinomonadaceae bacterium]|jgi:ubiquinone/menaquinone biosynthesis C-methylase UbiE|nr:class I SAM-dependent methyltransferase [Pyrinomonadaceae bacterium]
MDPVKRFSTRADNYAKYRPGYPAGVIAILQAACGLEASSTIADVGSGTGILTEMFLKNGNRVFAIEPNAAMRLVAERHLANYPGFLSVNAAAEDTTLADQSVDFVAAAQAFHWFDRKRAKQEFARILKPEGWVVLIWNERRLDSTPFLRAYEDLLLRYGTDYEKVRHETVATEIAEFFAPSGFQLKNLENYQHFDFESLKGRVLSSSYTPEPDHSNFEPMLKELQETFAAHEKDGIVSFEYETKIYYGRLGSLQAEA